MRINDALWHAIGRLANRKGTNRSEVVNQLIAWWVGAPGAEPPERHKCTLEELAEGWANGKDIGEAADTARTERLSVMHASSIEETVLYRYYDASDRLLYVGITLGLGSRTMSHIDASSWMDFAARSTITRFPTRLLAATAEREAIKSEHPLFNRVHNNGPEARGRLVEYLIEHGRTDLLVANVSRG